MSEPSSSPVAIDYSWSTNAEKQSCATFLFEESSLCSMNFIGNPIENLRIELKDYLLREIKLKEFKEKLKHLALSKGAKLLTL